MARSFGTGDAKRLLRLQKDISKAIDRVEAAADRLISEITSATENILSEGAAELLASVPVEELNRDKKGFRVKLLRDSGLNTVADVIKASEYSIASINGISTDGAHALKQAADEIARTARSGVRLSLSADDKNPRSTALVTALCKYKRSLPYITHAEKFKSDYGSAIAAAVNDLKPASGSLRWLFASSAKKAAADSAYKALSEMLSYADADSIINDSKACDRAVYVTQKDAWEDFASDSIRYINILETVVPDILGSGEVYGLPESLAQSVSDIELDLTGLSCTLRRYQEWGVKYALAQRRVLLGDEMGLGKTVQAIAVMVHLRNSGADRFAVVCPASVLTNWCREIAKHSDLRVIKVHGSGKEAAVREWVTNGGVAVTTYETTSAFDLDSDFGFTMLTVDEAHYIKNPGAQRTVNVRKLCGHAERLLFMTGTALENRVGEMASLIQILDPSVAADIAPMLSLSSAPRFREAVAPVYYRRKREDVLTELPELIESREWCTLTAAEKKVYREAVAEQNFMAARRVSWNVDDLSQSSKAQRMLELVNDAEEQGRKVIVFSFFLDTISKAASLLGDRCTEPITGSVSPARRQEIIDEFDKAPAGAVLAAQIQSGGTGLNIQSASVVIICEPQLKPSIENQAISRAYRMGQTRSVLVYRLLCDDTVDERITGLLADKQSEFDAFADESAAADDVSALDNEAVENIMKAEKISLDIP